MRGQQIEIADQPRLSLRRIVHITVDGIRYRVFRCAVTVAVIAVAVAFLNNILSESLVRRSASMTSRERLRDLHRVHEWAARLSAPGTIEDVLVEVAESEPGDPVDRECARFGGFDAAGMIGFRRGARQAALYLAFLDGLDYDLRRRLVHTARGTAAFDRLASAGGMTQFRTALADIKALTFVTTIPELESFLRSTWPGLKQSAQRVLAGRTEAIAAIERVRGTDSLLACLARADAGFGRTIRDAGFEFEPGQFGAEVAEQAKRLLNMRRIEKTLESQGVRRLVARGANVAPSDVTPMHLWRFARSPARANALLTEARSGAIDLPPGLEGVDVAALARTRREERRLAQIGRLTLEVGTGWLGMGERMGWLIAVSMLVCGIGITNAMLVSVTERFREIATLKCLGALDGFILILFVLESCMLGVAGGLLGALLGSLIGVGRALWTFGLLLPGGLPVGALLSGMALSVGAGVCLAAMAAVYPALKAARLAPMEAMRID